MLRAYLPSLKNYNVGESISNEIFSFPLQKNILISLVFLRENTVCNTSMSYSFGILSQTPTKAEKNGWKLEEEEAERVRAGQQAKGVKRGVNRDRSQWTAFLPGSISVINSTSWLKILDTILVYPLLQLEKWNLNKIC